VAEGAAFESAVNPTGAPPDSANPWLVVVIVCDVVSPSTTALGLVAPNDWLSADEVVQHSRPRPRADVYGSHGRQVLDRDQPRLYLRVAAHVHSNWSGLSIRLRTSQRRLLAGEQSTLELTRDDD